MSETFKEVKSEPERERDVVLMDRTEADLVTGSFSLTSPCKKGRHLIAAMQWETENQERQAFQLFLYPSSTVLALNNHLGTSFKASAVEELPHGLRLVMQWVILI